MTNELIALIANLALTLSFIIALIFGVVQMRTANRDRKERFTLETLRNFETREFAELLHYVTSEKLPSTTKEWLTMNGESRVRFIQFAQQMESMGLLLAEHYINI